MTFFFSFDLFFAFVGFYRIYGACVAGIKRGRGSRNLVAPERRGLWEVGEKGNFSRAPRALASALIPPSPSPFFYECHESI